jgi:hypothetical protein
MTGPVLFVLARDKGLDWTAAASTGVLYGVTGIAAFLLAFARIARSKPWPAALAIAAPAFFVFSLANRGAIEGLSVSQASGHALAAGSGILALLAAFALMPRPRAVPSGRTLPWWDIPVRMLVTAALVTAIMVGADRLGTALSGITSTFPVIASVVGSFTHYRWGSEALIVMMRGLAVSLLSFVGFFYVLGVMLVPYGAVSAFAAATIVSITGSLLVIWLLSPSRRAGP